MNYLVISAWGLVLVFLVYVVITESHSGERITTEQYYTDSLQYLEDIRNSNDEILAKCARL